MSEFTQPSLQDKVIDDLPTILSLLDEHYNEHRSPLIDIGFDNHDAASWQYLMAMQRVLELDEHTDALETMYHAFHFALNVAGLANWQYRDAPGFYGKYCRTILQQHGDNKEALTGQIIQDTQEYMAKNGALARVVATYSERIASEPALTSLSNTMAALTLMQIDDDMAARGSAGEVERLAAQLEAKGADIEVSSETMSPVMYEALYGAYDEKSTLINFDERYALCEPLPKHMHALFEGMRDTQRDLNNELHTSLERATHEGDSLTQNFNKALKSGKLLGKIVYLSGKDVHVPVVNIDPVAGALTTRPDPREDEEPERQLLGVSEVAGPFKGVYYKLEAIKRDGSVRETSEMQDSDELAGYRIVLMYQVKIGMYRHLHGKNDVYATGGLLNSTLEYDDDRNTRTIHDALEQLLSIESEKAAIYINEINLLLANRTLKFKALKQMAGLVKDLHECVSLTSAQSEALIDLIGAYIHPQGQYAMEVTDALGYVETKDGREVQLLTGENDATLTYQQQIEGIILAHGYERDPHDPETVRFDMKTREPYFVLEAEADDRVIHVPMRHLISFRVAD